MAPHTRAKTLRTLDRNVREVIGLVEDLPRSAELASAIAGATRPEQVHANGKASGIHLTPDTLAAIDRALRDAPVTDPTRRR
jgi:hypothetical protein